MTDTGCAKMTLSKIREILGADVIEADDLEMEVASCCGADLMSDVLLYMKPNSLLLTGLTTAQVVRTAEMAEIAAICFVRGKVPEDDIVALAKEEGIPLLVTSLPMYESCGRLYRNGLSGCSELADED